jgi:Zn-dependent peptidase ImmA (M78 family)
MGKFARSIDMRGLSFVDREALSFRKIRAITGQNDENTLLISGPKPPSKRDQRFLEARGIYHALYSGQGPRLVTDATTSDQQSARAFAAELLAPAAALTAYLDKYPNKESAQLIQELAEKYTVNPKAIELQLQNATFNS